MPRLKPSVLTPAGTSDHPHHRRIRRVLTRLSRDRWLNADDVQRIGEAVARKAGSLRPAWTLERALPLLALRGLLRGHYIAEIDMAWTYRVRLFQTLQANQKDPKRSLKTELLLLNHQAKKELQWTSIN